MFYSSRKNKLTLLKETSMVVSSPIRGIWLNDPISLDGAGRFLQREEKQLFFISKAIRKNVPYSIVFCCMTLSTLNDDLSVFPAAKG